MRTAESLEGALLTPEKRQNLMRLAGMLRLTPFDASLIIAIVQDQARRGHPPSYCAMAGADQLAMVPHRGSAGPLSDRARRLWIIAGLTACLIGLQLITVWWLVGLD